MPPLPPPAPAKGGGSYGGPSRGVGHADIALIAEGGGNVAWLPNEKPSPSMGEGWVGVMMEARAGEASRADSKEIPL